MKYFTKHIDGILRVCVDEPWIGRFSWWDPFQGWISEWKKTIVVIAALALFGMFAGPVSGFDLSWTPGSGGAVADGFKIYRKKPPETVFALLNTANATVTSFSDPDRTIGNCYRITAFNFVGESPPVEACANVPGTITILILK